MYLSQNVKADVGVWLILDLLEVTTEKKDFVVGEFLFVLLEKILVLDELHGLKHLEFSLAEMAVSRVIEKVVVEYAANVDIAFDNSWTKIFITMDNHKIVIGL